MGIELQFQPLGGFVTSAKDFSGKKQIPVELGVFSQQIFGPLKSYCCLCEKTKGILNKGVLCAHCGVLCDDNALRFTTFGKIRTLLPFVKSTKKKELANFLGSKDASILLDPTRSDINSEVKKYISVKNDFSDYKIVNNLKMNATYITIPFRITGTYSLQLCFKFLIRLWPDKTKALQRFFDEDIITNIVHVLPPNLRQIMFNNQFERVQTPQLNSVYKSILNCNRYNLNKVSFENYDRDEDECFEKLKKQLKDRILDQDIVENFILENDHVSYIYQRCIDKLYHLVRIELSGKEGLIRGSVLSKTIEFSARTVVRAEPSLDPYKIQVSQTILKKLWTPYFIFYLIHYEHVEPYHCLTYITSQDQNSLPEELAQVNLFDKFFDKFLTWFTTDVDDEYFTASEKLKSRLVFFNRQPTLWKHGIPCMEVVPAPDIDDKTIGVSPLSLAPLNMDFDGDTAAIYCIHDREALDELYDKAYYKNTFTYDANNEMLSVIRHETLYSAFILSYYITPTDNILEIIDDLQDLSEHITWMDNNLYDCVVINGYSYTYGMALLNKWMGISEVKINEQITQSGAEKISKLLFVEFGKLSFYDELTKFQKQLLFFISITQYCTTLDVTEMATLLEPGEEFLFSKLPKTNIELGYHLNEAFIDKSLSKLDDSSKLYKLYKSGSRFNKQQLSRSCLNIGFIADSNNIINPDPITTNLMKGLNQSDFFKGSPGTRKGIADKAFFTPDSGYLERTLVMALSIIIITEDDCNSDKYITTKVINRSHSESLIGKYFKAASWDINKTDWMEFKETDIDMYTNQIIHIRSPITCKTPKNKICRKCFGTRQFTTEFIGILAGQIIAERLTQLIMRSFHTSGSANLELDVDVKLFFQTYVCDIIEDEYEIIIKLTSDNLDIPQSIQLMTGFKSIEGDEIHFFPNPETVINKDAVQVMHSVKQILRKDPSCKKTPSQYYEIMMTCILSVGTPYSSFVELLFANMFFINNEVWRYSSMNKNPSEKLGDKSLAKKLDSKLGCMYEPNSKTLSAISDIDRISTDPSIYERIWFCDL